MTTEIISVSFDGHAGAIHRPTRRAKRGVAVVICAPLGRESRCAYRALFNWAQALAERGYQVLRYDHRGEGDSLDLDPAADQWGYWLDGVAQAADFARAHTGAPALVLAGLRVGATLAMAASEAIRPDGLILLAPVRTGAGWVRDLKLSAAIQNAPQPADGAVEVDGFRLSPATVASLETVNIKDVTPSWRAAFLAAPASGLAIASALGPDVATAAFEGYGKLFKEAHLSEAPKAVFEAAATWLDAFAADVRPPRPVPAPNPAQIATDAWTDRPVSFGDGLRGMLCRPRGAGRGLAVIIGNTAADPRAGVGGFATHAARALAAAGVTTLRFDFRGVGESADAPGGQIHVYETARLDDYLAAAGFLATEGYADPVLLGVCTGGYHAVRAVAERGPLRRAIVINSWLVWRPGRELDLRAEAAQAAAKPVARRAPAQSRLGRVLRGELNVTGAVMRRLRRAWSSWRPDPACRAVRSEVRRACRDGVEIHLLLGRGDRAMVGLEQDFGAGCGWLRAQRGVSVEIVPDLDHALFSRESQQKALQEIFRILRLVPAAPKAAADALDLAG